MVTYSAQLLTIKEASRWATEHLQKSVTDSNISYLIQYGRLRKYQKNGSTAIKMYDLLAYYDSFNGQREVDWQAKLGEDLNWELSFQHLKEKDTTKHIHRLHPYKGKFIPQLVEYFLDSHTDKFKKEVYFKKGDIVLDPFCGSGTTMAQANELGIHAVGVDISAFNALIANVKVSEVDFEDLKTELSKMTESLQAFIAKNRNAQFESELLDELNVFNKEYFPSPDYKIRVRQNELDEAEYGQEHEEKFLPIFRQLQEKYRITIEQASQDGFIDKWYLEPVRKEIDFMFSLLKKVESPTTKQIATIILSRTIRTCRATTHADLATLKEPVTETYYCAKHGKICKPLFSMLSWWERYSKDTIQRLAEFDTIRTDTHQRCLQGDARDIDLLKRLSQKNPGLADLVQKQKIKGIFSSPPYVGLIDYHEQHAYAYDLFGFQRSDDLEIGNMRLGQSKEARRLYVQGIADVLNHAKQYLQDDYDIFLVANDKYNMYPEIVERAGMKIVNQYKRPVLNRTEKDKSAYAEMIFHIKAK